MATDSQIEPAQSRLYKISVGQYLKMIRAGVFPESAQIELLGGKLVEQMTKYPPHNYVVGRLARALGKIAPEPWFVSEEKPVKLGRFWYPEPDIALVRGPDTLFKSRTPNSKDIGLLIEVSESSYLEDRGRKWRLYASSRVSCYWIVNLPKKKIEVYTSPSGKGEAARYQQDHDFVAGEEIPVMVAGQEIGRIVVSDILP